MPAGVRNRIGGADPIPGSGQWHPVDLDLVKGRDGGVEPKRHPRGLRLAAGDGTTVRSLKDSGNAAARDLVTLGEGDQQIVLQWKGGLPKPKLDGTRATYVNELSIRLGVNQHQSPFHAAVPFLVIQGITPFIWPLLVRLLHHVGPGPMPVTAFVSLAGAQLWLRAVPIHETGLGLRRAIGAVVCRLARTRRGRCRACVMLLKYRRHRDGEAAA